MIRSADRTLAWASFGAAGLWALLALVGGRLGEGVRTGVPLTNYGIGQAMLFSEPAQTLPILGFILFEIAAVIIGHALVIAPLWRARALASPPWLVLAGIVPGTLLIVAVTRLVTMVLPNASAPFAILALMFVTAGALLARDIRHAPPRRARWDWIGAGGAALAIAFVFQIHIDRFHALGDGAIWFINSFYLLPEHGVGASGHWPVFAQHYDEPTFLYPVAMGLMHPGPDASETFSTLFWIMNAVGRAGVLSLSYLAIRALGLDRLSALSLLLFVTGAALTINPISSGVLFDALNPLGFVLHEARILVPLFPLLLVAVAAAHPGKPTLSGIAISALLGLGMAATPIHGAMLIPFAAAIAVVTAFNARAGDDLAFWRAGAVAAGVLVIAFSFAYLWRGGPGAVHIAILIGGALAAGLTMLWALARNLRPSVSAQETPRLAPALLIAAALGASVGLALFGNVFVRAAMESLSHVWPWTNVAVVERLQEPIFPAEWTLERSPYCDGGYRWSQRMLAGHCGSLPRFVGAYGLPFIAALALMGWRLLSTARGAAARGRQTTMLFWTMILSLIAMPFAAALFDFIGPAKAANPGLVEFSVWARSRLLEPWFYGAVMAALVLFLRDAPSPLRTGIQSALLIATAVFLFNPLLLPAQFMANATYLFASFAHLFSGA